MTDDTAKAFDLDADPLRGDPSLPLDVELLHGRRWTVDANVSEAFHTDEDGVVHDHRGHLLCDDCLPVEEVSEDLVIVALRPGDPVVGDPAQAQSPINVAIRAAFRKARGFTPGGPKEHG